MGGGLKKPAPDLVLAATLTPGKARLFDATNATSATFLHELDCCSASNDPNENYTISILRVRFSPNGLKVGTALDHGVILWDVASGAPEPVLSFSHPRDFAFSPDGSLVVIVGPAGSFDSGVLVKNLATSAYYAAAVPSYGGYDAVAFSPDGTLLALATGNGGPCGAPCTPRIVLMRIPGNQVQRELLGHSKAIMTLAFSPDGSLLASGSSDNTARLWAIR
jgi:WD40 repeat protein